MRGSWVKYFLLIPLMLLMIPFVFCLFHKIIISTSFLSPILPVCHQESNRIMWVTQVSSSKKLLVCTAWMSHMLTQPMPWAKHRKNRPRGWVEASWKTWVEGLFKNCGRNLHIHTILLYRRGTVEEGGINVPILQVKLLRLREDEVTGSRSQN